MRKHIARRRTECTPRRDLPLFAWVPPTPPVLSLAAQGLQRRFGLSAAVALLTAELAGLGDREAR